MARDLVLFIKDIGFCSVKHLNLYRLQAFRGAFYLHLQGAYIGSRFSEMLVHF